MTIADLLKTLCYLNTGARYTTRLASVGLRFFFVEAPSFTCTNSVHDISKPNMILYDRKYSTLHVQTSMAMCLMVLNAETLI